MNSDDPATISLSEKCLRKAEWQKVLYSPYPRRYELHNLVSKWDLYPLLIRVHRNQAFEFVGNAMIPFSAYAGWMPEFVYSGYDDALNMKLSGACDVEIIWLDFERYSRDSSAAELVNWFSGRIEALRSITTCPILVSDWASEGGKATEFNLELRNFARMTPGIFVCDQAAIRRQLGEQYFDLRFAKYAGMSLSDRACILTARMFGLAWLPSVLRPRLKAVVLDLDNTLYSGVIGEDGVDGIVLTDGHLALQHRIVQLREDGIFVAICSRNEREDINNLFATRGDFPLRREHISAWSVSWKPKADGIRDIADILRISTDAILFIDDNPGELAVVCEQIHDIHCLHASEDAAATVMALSLYPGIWQWEKTAEDSLRVADLVASEEREVLARAADDPVEYLRSLHVSLCFSIDAVEHCHRLSELSNKTNQFNTAFLRCSESDIMLRINDGNCKTVSIHLRDRLSESGIIGLVLAHFEDDTLCVDEICVSCRALGRGLEDFMITQVLSEISKNKLVSRIGIRYKEGPRNSPAKEWLMRFFNLETMPSEGLVYAEWNPVMLRASIQELPVSTEWEQ